MIPLRSFFLLLLTLALSIAPAYSQQRNYNHDGGLWGDPKGAAATIATPVEKAVHERYDTLSDRGKFVAGAAFGFGASRFAVSSEFRFVVITFIVMHMMTSHVHGCNVSYYSPHFSTNLFYFTATVNTVKAVGAAYIA